MNQYETEQDARGKEEGKRGKAERKKATAMWEAPESKQYKF